MPNPNPNLPDSLRVPDEPRDCWFRGPHCRVVGLEYVLGGSLFIVCRGCLPAETYREFFPDAPLG